MSEKSRINDVLPACGKADPPAGEAGFPTSGVVRPCLAGRQVFLPASSPFMEERSIRRRENKREKKRIIVVMPAYNASKTLKKTVDDLPKKLIDEIILVDDASKDKTIEIAKRLGLTTYVHQKNRGYGANQKTCYQKALEKKADIIIMVHPDYQYDSSLTDELIRPIIENRFDIMFGSRIRTRKEALAGGMPWYKYILNRLLTPIENMILGVNFSEHLSGFRAYRKKVLETLPYKKFSDDFLFDQQLMISAIAFGFKVGEISVPVRYFDEASSIKFLKGAKFLLGTFLNLFWFILFEYGIYQAPIFNKKWKEKKS